MKGLLRSVAVLLLVLALAVPALAEVSQDDVDSAARKLDQLRQQSDALVAQYEDAWASSELLADQIQALTDLVSTSQVDIGIAEHKVQDRAVEMYMNGTGSEIFTAYVLSGGPGAGIGYLEETAAADQQLVTDLEALRRSYQRQLDDLEAARSEQDRVTSDMQALANEVLQQMGPAQAAYDALKEARARQLAEAEAARRAAEEEAARKAAAALSTTTAAPITVTTRQTTPTTVADTTHGPTHPRWPRPQPPPKPPRLPQSQRPRPSRSVGMCARSTVSPASRTPLAPPDRVGARTREWT